MIRHIYITLACMLFIWRTTCKPIVDPGVYVLQGVSTCRHGLGYCVIGNECKVDKDFIKDLTGGHCNGLQEAYSTNVSFVCCSYVGDENVSTEAYSTTLSPYTLSDSMLSHFDIELELTDEIPTDVDPSSLVNIIGVITDNTGIVSLVTEPYTGTLSGESLTPPSLPTTSIDSETLTTSSLIRENPVNTANTAPAVAESDTTKDSHSPMSLMRNEIPLDIKFLVAMKKKKNKFPLNAQVSSATTERATSNIVSFTEETLFLQPTTETNFSSIVTEVPLNKQNSVHEDHSKTQIETPVSTKRINKTEVFNYPSKLKIDSTTPSKIFESKEIPSIPFPINIGSCQTRNIISKKVRFNEVFSRGSAYDFCWSAALMLKYPSADGSQFICNGVLIEDDLIVTSATCLQRVDVTNLNNYRVVLGDSILTDDLPYGIQYHDILSTITHPSFILDVKSSANDIGIIRLKDHATLGHNVCLICIPQEHAYVPTESCMTTGYSAMNKRTRKSISTSGILKSRRVQSKNNFACDEKVGGYILQKDVDPDTLMCSDSKYSTADCKDIIPLGEPLVFCFDDNKWYLTGVASYGSSCRNETTIYTRITEFSGWILSTRVLLYGYITHKSPSD